eukprot:CAMPEP_0115760100 /NCGR_PEP_ID=MMETSP0272-20121206/99818_1 /TAXON_ID=71861 /ORGANISM="Scrippsiella trochoidea, Strain CCMP3099" /LENGTH=58 /DNA_ID=CAMNT_0003205741 /DNA_START=152 /DNA_END=325 /DNA_ORIENTATION=+
MRQILRAWSSVMALSGCMSKPFAHGCDDREDPESEAELLSSSPRELELPRGRLSSVSG